MGLFSSFVLKIEVDPDTNLTEESKGKMLDLDSAEGQALAQPAKKEVAVFNGRFQPMTAGHRAVIDRMDSSLTPLIVIIKGEKSSANKELNPFDIELQKEIILASCKDIPGFSEKNILVTNSSFILDLVIPARKAGYEIKKIYAGPDRARSYKSLYNSSDCMVIKNGNATDKLIKDAYNLDIEIVPVAEGDGSRLSGGISATEVRKMIKEGDYESFSQATVNISPQLFNKMRSVLLKGHNESIDIKIEKLKKKINSKIETRKRNLAKARTEAKKEKLKAEIAELQKQLKPEYNEELAKLEKEKTR